MISREKLLNDLIYCKGLRRKSLEAVIEVINKQPQIEKCADCSRRKWYTKGYQDGLNADKWIPCEKRLPSEEGFYVVTIDDYFKAVILNFSVTNQKWYWRDRVTEAKNVIAWQPLPQPYKKEGAE